MRKYKNRIPRICVRQTKKTSFEELVNLMDESDMPKLALKRDNDSVMINLAAYFEKVIVK